MDINATIIGQFITFAILVWFTMQYVWPLITAAIHEREKKIADGLEAAEHSKRELARAEQEAHAIVREAKQKASQVIEHANLHAAQLVEDAKNQAKVEGQRLLEMAQGEIDLEVTKAKQQLKNEIAVLAMQGAEKIIQRNLDKNLHQDLLNQLAAQI